MADKSVSRWYGGKAPARSPEGFMRMVEFDPFGGCWLWSGATAPNGYGLVNLWRGKQTGAHRHAFSLFRGEAPAHLNVCHRCDVPACVNPDHLWLGTDLQNAMDKVSKGRANVPRKLDDAAVSAIRRDPRPLTDIAEQYGVSASLVSAIRTGIRRSGTVEPRNPSRNNRESQ